MSLAMHIRAGTRYTLTSSRFEGESAGTSVLSAAQLPSIIARHGVLTNFLFFLSCSFAAFRSLGQAAVRLFHDIGEDMWCARRILRRRCHSQSHRINRHSGAIRRHDMTISPSQAPTKIDTIPISPYHALDLSFLCASPSPGNSPSHAAQIGKPRASHLSVPPPRMDLKPTPHCCTAPYHIFPTMRLYRTHHHPPDTHHKLHTALASPTQNPNP